MKICTGCAQSWADGKKGTASHYMGEREGKHAKRSDVVDACLQAKNLHSATNRQPDDLPEERSVDGFG